MHKSQKWLHSGPRVFLLLLMTLVYIPVAFSNPVTDTSKKFRIASKEKPKRELFITREANIVFPPILVGNEEQSLDYIEQFSAKRRDYIIRMYKKGARFFPKVAVILKKYDLPHEFKVLLALESAFNGNAVSRAGAVGYWQFMDEVAREYGLKIAPKKAIAKKSAKGTLAKSKAKAKAQVDDRKNFNKSTYAAARYLKDRCRNLDNDWLLIAASYNCGVGNVWNAMERSGKKNPDFWDIKNYLPAETRAYVMNFITLNVIFHNYEKFAANTLSFKSTKVKVDNTEQLLTEQATDTERGR